MVIILSVCVEKHVERKQNQWFYTTYNYSLKVKHLELFK